MEKPVKRLNFGKVLVVLALLLFFGGAASAQSPSIVYISQADDSLPRLAEKYYRDSTAWPAIAAANPALESPYLLPPGTPLVVPPAPSTPNPAPVEDIAPLSAAWLVNFSAYVEESRRHFEIPGAAVAVVRPQQIALAQGFGERELGSGRPVTPDTVFAIGSTTKAMNAALVASLVDDGALSWDDRVSDLWPDFALSDAAGTPQITLRDLLSMRSGLPRADLVWSGSGMSAGQVMESLADLPLEAEPGEQFAYNNQAVATAGFVAALSAGGQFGRLGADYRRLMQQRLFDTVGMRQAGFAPGASPNHARPHDFTLAGQTTPTHFHTDPGTDPAGGVNASITDLARFVQMQLARGVAPNGQRVVSSENLIATWQPQIELYPGNSYALGWFVEEYRGVEMIWHDGDVLGFKSLLVLLPQANVGLALLSNRTVGYGFSNSVRYHFVEQVYGLEADAGQFYRDQWTTFIETGLPEARAPLNPTPPPADVAPVLGNYAGGWQVLQHADGSLWATRGDYGWQLWADDSATEPGQFVIGNGFGLLSPLEFVPTDDGIVMRVELATGETGEYRKQ
jgi:CubicO group peptidase (beta-lactamase class C family)